jgi:hypothetical protein
MFARWFHVRIRAAEKALLQGRLDDALAIAAELNLREDSRGQALLDALAKPLEARARLHRQAGRYREALVDLDRLAGLNREGPDAKALRQQIAQEVREGARRSAQDRDAYQQAADHLRAGHLETGRLQLDNVEDARQHEQLAGELERRVQRGGQLLQQAADALGRDDVLAALRYWQEAARHGRTAETDGFAARLAVAGRQAVDRWHAEGRTEGLLAARAGIGALAAHDPALADCERLIELCARAAAQLAATDYAGLRQTLLRLKAARGAVAWVNAALDALTRIAEGQEQLLTSPLGLFATTAGERTTPDGRAVDAATAARGGGLDACDPNALRLDRPLLMLVDGGGSSLLLRRDQVRIGHAGSTTEIDVPLPAELQSHHADIIRRGGDYFLTAFGPARVNQQPVQQRLLHDGDQIALGEARLTFHKPSSKSESAVLRLSHRCRLPQDVSDVVLFRDTCLIGPAATCHVRTREDDGQIVLFERGGALYARPIQDARLGGPTLRAAPVVAGQTLEVARLRVTVKPYM